MNSKLWVQKAFAMCLLATIITTGSMAVLAGSGPIAGELTFSRSGNGSATISVNGEPVTTGRTISPSSVISVPEGMTAVVNFGKLGKVQFGANTTVAINATENGLSSDLSSGSLTVLESAKGVTVKTLTGDAVTLNSGETINASAASASKQTTKSSNEKWWVWALILGGATAAVVLAATNGSDNNFGGGSTTVSPVR